MIEEEYTKYRIDQNGSEELEKIYSIKDCLRSINERFESAKKEINRLKEENDKLENNYYKDKEIAKMQRKIDILDKAYRNGFSISDSEKESIEEWQEKHNAECHLEDYSEEKNTMIERELIYEFIPLSVGTIGKVKCSCGEEFCFRDIN